MNKEHLMYSARARFEAARRIAGRLDGHRQKNLHGHSFQARVRAALPPGWASFQGAESDELEMALKERVQPLDYRFLNEQITEPTDENIARWVRDGMSVSDLDKVGISSTNNRGTDIDAKGQIHCWRRYRFEAAHSLPNVPEGHKCGRMHGHGFVVILHHQNRGEDKNIGKNIDLIDRCWQPLFDQLDHACLNDIPGLENPTSELIAGWLWHQLKTTLTGLSWVTVLETASSGCCYDGANYRIWKASTLDSAVRLENAPEGDTRRRIHGHTFTIRLHLSAPLDQVMGWVVDFGDVKERFKPVFNRLDHRPLYEVPGLKDCSLASLARWTRQEIGDSLPELDRIDLEQTPGCGVTLAWGTLDPALPI